MLEKLAKTAGEQHVLPVRVSVEMKAGQCKSAPRTYAEQGGGGEIREIANLLALYLHVFRPPSVNSPLIDFGTQDF
ncbi:hypothetical protein [Roseofilum sp. Guam]|uniref:hypothetical protein n=1 Tax=Roseofilum sp. Guam TaxID=2821502 RepID=UPI001B11B001|nr:hypothetical protein [Roseofilum sp. Guam]MBP0029295.1 hypothetical protein [Roseofilum sp. Guam]